ncbi:MAG: TonB-dependent receptor [Gemmatimonadetes bacterium]|nr:TonB-dependent receptor [Gemmatimonadota bacterium]
MRKRLLKVRSQRGGVATAAAVLLAVMLAMPAPVSGQEGTVTGTVTDAASQRPVGSVQVFLVGTGLGTLSRDNGRFVILNVPAGDYTLRAERIGYTAMEAQVTIAGGTVQQDFAIDAQALGLDEIVVTGTAGAARRREIGNTVSLLDVGQDVVAPPNNVDALLQARVPGMSVTQSSASVGGGAMIRLRGNVSMTQSNQPLIYIDGVRVRSQGFAKNVPPVGYSGRSNNDVSSPLNSVNPQDIERVEVIKGAAATTLYGTEASAGVIQIFTKRGSVGEATWTGQTTQGVARNLTFGPDPALRPPSENPTSLSGGRSDFLFINPWLRGHKPKCGDAIVVDGQPCDSGLFSDVGAHQQDYALSVGGGAENVRYFVSGSYEHDDGVLANDQEKKVILRGNFSFNPMDDLQLQWNTSYTNDQLAHTAAGNNAHGMTLNTFRRDRNYLNDESFNAINPFLDQEITTQIDHLITGLTATYSPMANFSNRFSVGYDLAQQDNRNLRPFGFIRAPSGILATSRYEFNTLTVDYVGSLDLELPAGIRSALSFGGQSVTTRSEQTTAYGDNFPGPGDPDVDNAGNTLGFEDRTRIVNAGLFVQNVFDFSNKYFVTVGLRVDGNSAFGADFGLQSYPKISGSYVISDEDFWNEGWGSMKLRAAWGQAGRAPGAFDAVRTFAAAGWGGVPAFLPSNVGNAEIGPETTSELEMGFEASMLDDRLGLDFTYFAQTTSDALFSVRQVPSLGFTSSQLANVGELVNNGFELGLNYSIVRNDTWSWDVNANLAFNDSEITSLGDVPSFSIGGFGWVIEGEPAPVIRADCVTNKEDRADPIIEQDCLIGPNQAPKIAGFGTTFGLPFGILVTARGEYQGGAYMLNGPQAAATRRSVRWAGCFEAYNTWETQGYAALTAEERARCDVKHYQSDFAIQPADFFKIRELSAQAPLPDAWAARLGASRATVTFSGRNFFRWVDPLMRTMDPEVGGNVGFNTRVRSMSEHVPPPAFYTFALQLVF